MKKCPNCGNLPTIIKVNPEFFVTLCTTHGCEMREHFDGKTVEESTANWDNGVQEVKAPIVEGEVYVAEHPLKKMYGSVITKASAGRILGCSQGTVYRMIDEGKLRTLCGGKKVDIDSVIEYIERPAEVKRRAQRNKTGERWRV